MHGISSHNQDDLAAGGRGRGRLLTFLRNNRNVLLWVILPTLLVALYYGLIASDQYESEAHYIVRATDSQAPSSSGFGQVFGLVGAVGSSQAEAYSVSDYLSSHDAATALQRKLDLVSIFRRPGVDWLSRLRTANPTEETLTKFYNRQVSVKYNTDTGITTLKVRTFRPADSVAIVTALLTMGEARVNALNRRSYASSVENARIQLADAENALQGVQSRMTGFRHVGGDIDPAGTGASQTQLVSRLRQTAAEARAQLQSMSASVSASSPQVAAMRRRVQALDAQVAGETARLTGGGGDIATGLGGYEELKLRQEFAAKRYESAAAAVERAREQAQKQQLFIVRVVEPNLPQKSLYPARLKIILSVLAGLIVAYSIGWLIVAGVKEHAS